ncbi:cancer-related nucleoside-triphosphatase homolog [Saccoglossus kowalevskii]|uniref:Cancer-related nucleoside-triphosphatase homolog n=1 Tax=Saccoglossus kowalevskii TaxID=10224 RepID=A0ABM0GWX7_SACKO|nr:PREDICTED: cancer-related nucleoside-triphosphatase homolog [Saccoglossus kowalevskii]
MISCKLIWIMATSLKSIKHVILTGPPGVGKTTLIQRVTEKLQSYSVSVQGFYTEEVRGGHGKRVGFDVVTLDGKRGTLARVSQGGSGGYRVGQYKVDLSSFEHTALPVLATKKTEGKSPIYVIDEIGKMEMFSDSFKVQVQSILNQGITVLATIPIPKARPLLFVEEIRSRQDVKIFTVTKENRDNLLTNIVDTIMEIK